MAWGYGPRGYAVLARSPGLAPATEALFLDLAGRWPFEGTREAFVLARREVRGLGACAVLLRSRMHAGPPAHRQTSFALFRVEELAATWAGFLPLLECLPPYEPTGPVLPAVELGPRAEPTRLAALDPALDPGAAWLADAWARLLLNQVVALPPFTSGREAEVVDLVACSLPPRVAARLGVAVGLRRAGMLASGPALEGAPAASRPGSIALGAPPATPVLEWAQRHAGQGARGGEAALALRDAIAALAREEGRDPAGFDAGLIDSLAVRERAVAWLLGGTAPDREAMGWLAAILPDDARVRALERALLARPSEVAASPGLPAARLTWAVDQLEGCLSLSPFVPGVIDAARVAFPAPGVAGDPDEACGTSGPVPDAGPGAASSGGGF